MLESSSINFSVSFKFSLRRCMHTRNKTLARARPYAKYIALATIISHENRFGKEKYKKTEPFFKNFYKNPRLCGKTVKAGQKNKNGDFGLSLSSLFFITEYRSRRAKGVQCGVFRFARRGAYKLCRKKLRFTFFYACRGQSARAKSRETELRLFPRRLR